MNIFFRKSAPLILLVLALVFFSSAIFQNKTFFAFDCVFNYLPWKTAVPDVPVHNPLITDPINAFYPPFFYPAHYFYQNALTAGEVRFWFDANFCGVPFANYSSPFVGLLYAFFPLTVAHDLLLFFSIFGAGIFGYLFLRQIGLGRAAGLVGAIAWMFNGYIMVWLEFEHVPMLAMSLPATFYAIEMWRRHKSRLSFWCMTGTIAFSICTAYAHLIIYQLLFTGVYVLYRCLPDKNELRQNWQFACHTMMGAVAAIVLSLIISANFFVTHLMYYQEGQRRDIPYSELFNETGQVPAKYLSTFLFPDFYGSPALDISLTKDAFPRPYNNYNELCIYCGIFSLFMIAACFPFLFRKKHVVFFMTVAIVTLLMAMGSLLYYPLARFVPGLSLSTPTRILYIFGFCMSVLTGLGADILFDKSISIKKWPIVLSWVFIVFVAFILVVYVQSDSGIRWALGNFPGEISQRLRDHFSLFSPHMIKPLLMVAASFMISMCMLFSVTDRHRILSVSMGILILAYDLISFGQLYNTVSPRDSAFPPTSGIRFLQKDNTRFRIMTFGNFLQNSFVRLGLEDIGGYGSFYPRRYGEFLHMSQHGPESTLPSIFSRWINFSRFGSPLLDLINVKYVLAPPEVDINISQLEKVYDGEIKIYRNLNVFPRLFFVPGFKLAANRQEAYDALGQVDRAFYEKTVILETPPPSGFQTDQNSVEGEVDESEGAIRVLHYSPDRIELEIATDRSGFLVNSDNYDSGWTAAVDGRKTDILRANYIMRAIPVEKGVHRIELAFRPKMLIGGLIVTAAGWAALFVAIGWSFMAKISQSRKQKYECS